MIHDLKQWVPSAVCLSCDGCCRFKEKDSAWRPKITPDEIVRMKKPDLLTTIYAQKNVEPAGYIKTVACGGETNHCCSFFSSKDNTCTIYAVRPLECRLYPFVLTKKDNGAAVSMHHHCPYVQDKQGSEDLARYVAYLKEYFRREETLQFLKSNPSLIGDYPDYRDELELLFTIYE